MKNKRAMSEVVTTILMVVLALVAIVVIWQIISNLIGERGAQMTITQKCLDVKLTIQGVTECAGGTGCTISVKRSAGGDEFGGVRVVLVGPDGSSQVIDKPGNIGELETVSLDATLSEADPFDSAQANKVEMTVYFTDESGQVKNCPSPAIYNFNQGA